MLMQKNKIIKMSVVFIALIIVILGILYVYLPPNVRRAENWFEDSEEDILIVTKYLKSSEHQVINIHDSEGYMSLQFGDKIKIDDDEVSDAIDRLISKGYKGIFKDNNTIHFLKWTRFMDFGAGLAYSINGVDEPELQFLTKLEPLSKDGWFYYEEDYNEWSLTH